VAGSVTSSALWLSICIPSAIWLDTVLGLSSRLAEGILLSCQYRSVIKLVGDPISGMPPTKIPKIFNPLYTCSIHHRQIVGMLFQRFHDSINVVRGQQEKVVISFVWQIFITLY